jgi:predicted TIM-barrel fold metal-dependent hydrolase
VIQVRGAQYELGAVDAHSRREAASVDWRRRFDPLREDTPRRMRALAELPRVILKYSNWGAYKGDLGRLTRRLYDTFGPERIIWGTLGNTPPEYRKQVARFEELLAFASEADRARIRGGNAQRLFFN